MKKMQHDSSTIAWNALGDEWFELAQTGESRNYFIMPNMLKYIDTLDRLVNIGRKFYISVIWLRGYSMNKRIYIDINNPIKAVIIPDNKSNQSTNPLTKRRVRETC